MDRNKKDAPDSPNTTGNPQPPPSTSNKVKTKLPQSFNAKNPPEPTSQLAQDKKQSKSQDTNRHSEVHTSPEGKKKSTNSQNPKRSIQVPTSPEGKRKSTNSQNPKLSFQVPTSPEGKRKSENSQNPKRSFQVPTSAEGKRKSENSQNPKLSFQVPTSPEGKRKSENSQNPKRSFQVPTSPEGKRKSTNSQNPKRSFQVPTSPEGKRKSENSQNPKRSFQVPTSPEGKRKSTNSQNPKPSSEVPTSSKAKNKSTDLQNPKRSSEAQTSPKGKSKSIDSQNSKRSSQVPTSSKGKRKSTDAQNSKRSSHGTTSPDDKNKSKKSQDVRSPYLPPSPPPPNSKKKSIPSSQKRPSNPKPAGPSEDRKNESEVEGIEVEEQRDHHFFDVEQIKKDAPKVLRKRLKIIREYEEAHPKIKMNDKFIQEYLFQDIKEEHNEVAVLPDKPEITAEDREIQRKKKFDRKTLRDYHRKRKPHEDKRVQEEFIPASETPREARHGANAPTKSGPPTPAPTQTNIPISQKDRDKRTAEARKKLKELEKERIQIGPDPEMLKTNKALEQAVIQQSLAKKALIDIANKREAQKGQKGEHDKMKKVSNEYKDGSSVHKDNKEKRRSYLQPPTNSDGDLLDKKNTNKNQNKNPGRKSIEEHKDDKSGHTKSQNKSKPSAQSEDDDEDITAGLELEDLESLIKREEDMKKAAAEGKNKNDESPDETDEEEEAGELDATAPAPTDPGSKKESKKEETKTSQPRSNIDEAALFKKIRGEQEPDEKKKDEEKDKNDDKKKDQKEEGKDKKKDSKDKKNDKKDDPKSKKDAEKKDKVKDKEVAEGGEESKDAFEVYEQPPPPVEYQDLVYGNVRFLNLNSIKPLHALRADGAYDDMFGMISNKKWAKLHFTMDRPFKESKEPSKEPSKKPKKKKAKKPKKTESDEDKDIKLSPSFLDLMKANTGTDYDKVKVVSRIPRSHMYARPARQVFYVELPMEKTDYKADWEQISKDMQKKVRKKKKLPEFLTSVNPQEMMGMLIQRAELNALAAEAEVWTGKKEHSRNDYFDWMMTGLHPLDSHGEDLLRSDIKKTGDNANDPEKKKEWFNSPPHYKPESPADSLFDEFNFCGYGDRGKPYFLEFTLPRHNILYNMMYKSNTIFNSIKKPHGSFPGFALPRWLTWPLDQKLPQHSHIPIDTLHWTRGHLGNTLRPKVKGASFKLHDPMDIDGQEYNSLHDENCRDYLVRPNIKDHLFSLNLINTEGEVLCNQKEQNQYRMYLRDAAWREDCEKACKVNANRVLHQLAGYRYFQKEGRSWIDQRTRWKEIIQNAKKIKEDENKAMVEKYKQIEVENKRRLEEIKEEREMKKEDRHYRKQALYPRPSYQSNQMALPQLIIDKEINSHLKQANAANKRDDYQNNKNTIADEKKRIFWQNKLNAMNQKSQMNKWASDVSRDERKRRIVEREEHVVAQRKRLPEILLERKLASLWLKGIVRKYAMRWLEITRKRKKEREDQKHNSRWDTEHLLNEMVDNLTQESGYKKFDNIVLNLFNANQLKILMKPKNPMRSLRRLKPDIVTILPPATNQFSQNNIPIVQSSATDNSIGKGSDEDSDNGEKAEAQYVQVHFEYDDDDLADNEDNDDQYDHDHEYHDAEYARELADYPFDDDDDGLGNYDDDDLDHDEDEHKRRSN